MGYTQLSPLRTLFLSRPHTLTSTFTKPRQISLQYTCQSITTSSRLPSSFRSLLSTKAVPRTSSPGSLPTTAAKRYASTASAASPSQTVQTANASSETPLTWNEFLRLRRIRRYYNLGASIGTSFTTLVTGMATLSQQNLSALGQQLFGLDPFVLIGLCAVGFWGVGWLLGPLVGTGVFQLFYRARARGMAAVSFRVRPMPISFHRPLRPCLAGKLTNFEINRRKKTSSNA